MAVDSREQLIQNIPGNVASGLSDQTQQTARTIYSYEQDTNRLSRGDPQNTHIITRDSTRRQNISTALSIDTWNEPPAAYGATYPHNHVYQTPNGLVQEFDDTPNNVRYHRYHPAGTYVEVDSNGTEVRKIIGDNYYIVERNGYIFIGGEASITVSGKCSILVTNDCNLQVDGKLDAVVKNDINLTTSGNFNLNVKETFKVRADNLVVETVKYNHENLGEYNLRTNTFVQQMNKADISIQGPLTLYTKKYDMIVDTGAFTVQCNQFDLNSKEKFTVKSGSTASLDGSEVRLGGSTLHVQAGTVKASTNTKESVGSEFFLKTEGGPSAPEAPGAAVAPTVTNPQLTGLVTPAGRANPDRSPIPPLGQTSNRFMRAAIENDGGSGPSSTSLYPGYNTPVPYTGPEAQVAGNTPAAIVAAESVDSSTLINRTDFTGEEQISQYAKLKDLTTGAVFGHRIRAQAGLSVGDIAANLQALAVNVIDKLAERYGRGSFIITSGFRPEAQARGGSGTSQHSKGQAVDIQFPSLPAGEYANRAQELLSVIPFDQLILEYQTTGTGRPWIHISFTRDRNKRQFFTMMNHTRTSEIRTIT